jgi:hypothetical protein
MTWRQAARCDLTRMLRFDEATEAAWRLLSTAAATAAGL